MRYFQWADMDKGTERIGLGCRNGPTNGPINDYHRFLPLDTKYISRTLEPEILDAHWVTWTKH